jgi:hypothetical protein
MRACAPKAPDALWGRRTPRCRYPATRRGAERARYPTLASALSQASAARAPVATIPPPKPPGAPPAMKLCERPGAAPPLRGRAARARPRVAPLAAAWALCAAAAAAALAVAAAAAAPVPSTPLAAETMLFYNEGPTLIVASATWSVLAPLVPTKTSTLKGGIFLDGATTYKFNVRKLRKVRRGRATGAARGGAARGVRTGLALLAPPATQLKAVTRASLPPRGPGGGR